MTTERVAGFRWDKSEATCRRPLARDRAVRVSQLTRNLPRSWAPPAHLQLHAQASARGSAAAEVLSATRRRQRQPGG